MVYNGTSCGLNDCVWAPNFWMPTPQTAVRHLDFGYYMIDIDLGEFFLNFPLHHRIQPHTGVDLRTIKSELEELDHPSLGGGKMDQTSDGVQVQSLYGGLVLLLSRGGYHWGY